MLNFRKLLLLCFAFANILNISCGETINDTTNHTPAPYRQEAPIIVDTATNPVRKTPPVAVETSPFIAVETETPTSEASSTPIPTKPGMSNTTAVLISKSPSGGAANGASEGASIAADGRTVAFVSTASNLVSDDLNEASDVFVHDLTNGETTRVSVTNSQQQSSYDSGVVYERGTSTSVSSNGRRIAFQSYAQDLVTEVSGHLNVFVYDRMVNQLSVPSRNGNEASTWPVLSADGSTVAFISTADNLRTPDTNNGSDVFVYDFALNSVELVSKSSSGTQGNGWNGHERLSVSADGRIVVFESTATNLSARDENDQMDIYAHDRQTGSTRLISVAVDGKAANGRSEHPAISGNGRYIAFTSYADNLVTGDTNDAADIFLFDRETGEIKLITKAIDGRPANGASYTPHISHSGRYITFSSVASNLVSDDNNTYADVFVVDVETSSTFLVSRSFDGAAANHMSLSPMLSGNGTTVVFQSLASNLVPEDTNDTWDIFWVDLTTQTTTPDE